jgi:hypothetical protein
MALNMALKNHMDWIDGNNFNVWNNRGSKLVYMENLS